MSEINYEELGFKCGIEIHQQLATETKLFCDCPVDLQDEAADHRVHRYLRAVAGETGEKDEAAEVAAEQSKKYIYKYYNRNNCLVELDEEPPHSIDEEALNTALTFARMVNAEIPDEIQVMRKMVVDGSNTSGFQRTAMIGLEGELETDTGTVNIDDIELEEESAGIHERDENKALYDLNRLGVPLVEVGTDASIENPEHAREVAKKIGMLLRSTGKARRGIGTIRQDVNVSIEDGSRVEIKGFQDVENIDKVIENEVKRQKNLVELGEELEKQEIVADNVTHHFEETDNQIISTVLENDGAVYAMKLPGLTGKMKQKISGDRYVAKELVDYAKSRGVQGILHTDEDIENYQLVEEFEKVADDFDKEDEDVIAVIAAGKDQAKAAAQAVRDRARLLYEGEVPEETRTAEQDFTTSYARPLPGSARMYPETDIPAVRVTEGDVEEIDQDLPETLEEREEKYSEEIGEELASQIVYSERLPLFEKFKAEYDTKLVANFFTNIYSGLEKEVDLQGLEEEHYGQILEALDNEEITNDDLEKLISEFNETGQSIEEIVEEIADSKTSEEEIREVVKEVVEQNKGMIEEQGMHAQGALMGQVMGRVEADGGTVSRILQEELQKEAE
ncbi:Glu-tRNA(Gln) amidotransferase subunit GatE [Candidatus Nanohalovita haloferacivicina]|uniref:Glu-tRNA(Gln) amidotransferase subunit GatE n=1 Tax=Candidatus Nanohalovita haloferacivicina TaxID=2978046 RepID=UPI00325FBB57|nr:Glutamyl-tRNA(Gln) amidotransferase subunit E [Candidatus Nanohalobia archaeon BNXNv]